ncbi:MAG: 16S rRNA (uracil(1498)-N(3))-methyltransferase [Clostridia bacterium]
MEKRRFYIDKDAIIGDKATLYDDERNHLVNVLRMNIGDEAILVCGDGFDYVAKVILIEKQYVLLEIISKDANSAEPKKRLDVFQGVAKGEKMDLITQKLTELGARALIPFVSTFTVAKENTVKLDRLNKITREAIKQCKRSNCLIVEEAVQFDEMLSRIGDYDLVIFAYEKEVDGNLNSFFTNLDTINKVAIIVGAEGGFSEEEAEKIVRAGAKIVTLGKRILRCETAAIVLSALVMYEMKEMN